ncbi:MAG TPA: enoyl-CoA hydratase [Xanthobacteraceae bacterium]|nr:enoyl-CoA hydratase [Xanthobacteraceae bacterium]
MSKPARSPETSTAEPMLLREDKDGITTLTLNRPAARNALNEELMDALIAALQTIGGDRSVRAVILAANGPVFCAGHDLKEMTAHREDADKGRAYFKMLFDKCAGMMQAIVHLPQPVIASVQGIATAAGCQLVASCDLVVAAENASFATPGVQIGLFCSSPMVALSRKVASNHAFEMLSTGALIPAQRAYEMGLVNRVVPAGESHHGALELAQKITSKSAYVLKIGKEAFYRQLDMSLADAYKYGAGVMAENMMARDAEEGIGAFIEKRDPKWEDR